MHKNSYSAILGTAFFPVLCLTMMSGMSVASADVFVPQRTRLAGGPEPVVSTAAASRDQAARMETANVNLPPLNGVMIYSDSWPKGKPEAGFYSLPRSESDKFTMIVPEAFGSAVVVGDRLYTIARITMPELDIDYPRYTVYDLVTGQELYFENIYAADWTLCAVDMDIDPVSGDVYAITYNKDMTGYLLSILEMDDKSVKSKAVAALPGTWNSVAFDSKGNLYGINKDFSGEGQSLECVSSALNRIDKVTGEVTPIGETGFIPDYASSATFDRASDRLFWTVSPSDGSGFLTEVDTATGKATAVLSFPGNEEITGLYAPVNTVVSAAPDKVRDLSLSFEEGSLTGEVSFVAPTNLFDGTPGTGDLTYTIRANDKEVATGTTSYGSGVEATVTLQEPARYEIVVTVSNSAGEGPVEKVIAFIGSGCPQTPFVRASYADGRITVAWQSVTDSSDGGYVDPSEVTYNVVRQPGDVTVATDLTETSYEDVIEVPTEFTVFKYEVTAVYDGRESEPGISRGVGIGDILPPYSETFDEESSVDGWTIIDVKRDFRLWMWSTLQNLRISFHNRNAMDDWAITPSFRLEAGIPYRLTFKAYCDDLKLAEKMEVKTGAANTADAMTTTLMAPFEIQSLASAPQVFSVDFTPERSGSHYIGFHGISDPDCYMLNLDDVSLVSLKEAGVTVVESGAVVSAAAGRIIVGDAGNSRVRVYSLDGMLLSDTVGGVDMTAVPGVYVVNVDGKCVKLRVK